MKYLACLMLVLMTACTVNNAPTLSQDEGRYTPRPAPVETPVPTSVPTPGTNNYAFLFNYFGGGTVNVQVGSTPMQTINTSLPYQFNFIGYSGEPFYVSSTGGTIALIVNGVNIELVTGPNTVTYSGYLP